MHFAGPVDRCFERRLALGPFGGDVLGNDDGVVHQDADDDQQPTMVSMLME